jgi:hypothetical protein
MRDFLDRILLPGNQVRPPNRLPSMISGPPPYRQNQAVNSFHTICTGYGQATPPDLTGRKLGAWSGNFTADRF